MEGAMDKRWSKRASLTLTLVATCFSGASCGQGGKAEQKGGDDAEARQERIETGIAPVEIGGGQPPLKVSLAELMKAGNVPALSVAVIDGNKIVWTKAYGTTELGGTGPATPKTL